jgi:hypothetical protein
MLDYLRKALYECEPDVTVDWLKLLPLPIQGSFAALRMTTSGACDGASPQGYK